VVPDARIPIRIQKVDVRGEVVGTTAHTRIELVFFNPNERQLEGELQFPLMEGQSVTGFALDINEELRSAVPVEKAKGQQVFEELARARIDPALLEKTQGNNYKLRIFPLPAKGVRRVVLELDDSLPRDTSGNTNKHLYYVSYQLPLQFSAPVEQLNVAINNPTSPDRYSAMAVQARLGAESVRVHYGYERHAKGGSLVDFSRTNYVGKQILRIDYPRMGPSTVVTEEKDGQIYFYAELPTVAGKQASRPKPQKLGIVWDASASGATRDHGLEFAMLDAYLKSLGHVVVQLQVARDRAEPLQTFTVKDGDWKALRAALENLAYDGATSGEALTPGTTAELNLLFSDGLVNFGQGHLQAGQAPLFAVNSVAGADVARLRQLADGSGGRVLNLLNTSAAQAVFELGHLQVHLAGLHSNGATDLVSNTLLAEGDRIKIAGVLTQPQASIDLDWMDANGQHQVQQVNVANTGGATSTVAAQRWAALQLARLEVDFDTNRAAIQRLGKRFGLVTGATSLIVLDRVEDYVRYDIVPPPSLRAEYEAQVSRKSQQLHDDQIRHIDDIAQRFAQKVSWWETAFPKGDKPQPKPQAMQTDRERAERLQSAEGSQRAMSAPRPVAIAMAAPPPPVAMTIAPASVTQPATGVPQSVGIRLKKWEPDASYAKRLREATPEQMYAVYLDERPSQASSSAFFLDAADVFFERGQSELGLRILSNLAEMNLENRQILRILAYRLVQAKQVHLALPVLKKVLALSPDEPQSWRDLGLAYAQDGQHQLAIDNLWQVVSRPWHNRFPDIELVTLAELNAVVADVPTGTTLDTSHMDARLLRNLPLEVRAVLSWDADNTDIDLWITDPNDEKVYYANRLGYQGGAMSRDFTNGYGPEEFSLRHAKPGKYKVQAYFFGNRQQLVAGATTLMLRLSTGFGTPQQHDESIVLRLSGTGSIVDVGEFEVGKPTP
jgi:tetratricopeptide (TPR) repeat protein